MSSLTTRASLDTSIYDFKSQLETAIVKFKATTYEERKRFIDLSGDQWMALHDSDIHYLKVDIFGIHYKSNIRPSGHRYFSVQLPVLDTMTLDEIKTKILETANEGKYDMLPVLQELAKNAILNPDKVTSFPTDDMYVTLTVYFDMIDGTVGIDPRTLDDIESSSSAIKELRTPDFESQVTKAIETFSKLSSADKTKALTIKATWKTCPDSDVVYLKEKILGVDTKRSYPTGPFEFSVQLPILDEDGHHTESYHEHFEVKFDFHTQEVTVEYVETRDWSSMEYSAGAALYGLAEEKREEYSSITLEQWIQMSPSDIAEVKKALGVGPLTKMAPHYTGTFKGLFRVPKEKGYFATPFILNLLNPSVGSLFMDPDKDKVQIFI